MSRSAERRACESRAISSSMSARIARAASIGVAAAPGDRLLQLRSSSARRASPNGGSTTLRDLPHHQHRRIVQAHAPGPEPGTRGVQRLSLIGWWHAWQSNSTSSGKRPSRLRFGSASTSIISATTIAWPIAQTCDAVPRALALLPVGVDLEVRRLDRGERVELEAHPRMARAHHPVGDEAVGVAEVARQAQRARATGSSVGYRPASRFSACVAPCCDVRLAASARRAVAGLAGHAVVEPGSARRAARGHVVRVAVEAELRLWAGFVEAEVARDALRPLVRAAPWYARACLSTRDHVTYSVCRTLESFHGCTEPWQRLLAQLTTPSSCPCSGTAASVPCAARRRRGACGRPRALRRDRQRESATASAARRAIAQARQSR